ncbi:ElaB/YgaM/YqjD family protein [Neisseria chenwenguii]|uniref:ElaB protein n=1 Tax=Neisseria chenwenguii TaxID=1853278 RepID=A0A220RZT3_9NEIS|nr:DUF883 family protein [Neisseria chenwenguii]ASK26662.1 ElaB protein [Neisseria chenwenguii]ROV56323.1 DUF883 family protein [Neisseria chenwenguii]
MDKQDFEARRDALLKDIREVMDDVEALYNNSADAAGEQAQEAKAKLQEKLEAAKGRLNRFESEAAERFKHHAEQARDKYHEFEEQAGEKFRQGKRRFAEFEAEAGERIKHHAKQADQAVHDKPYYAIGFAALAGLVVGVLLNRR